MPKIDLSTKPIKNIAVSCRQLLGDFILTTTLLNYCREMFPQAKLWIFGWDFQRPLLKYFSAHDHFVEFSDRYCRTGNIFKNAILNRRQKFDLAIDTKDHPSATGALFSLLLGAKYRAGFVNKDLLGKFINYGTDFIPEQKNSIHTALMYLRFLDPIIKEIPEKFYPKFVIPAAVKEQYQKQLNQSLATIESYPGPLLYVSVSSNGDYRYLGEQRFAEVLNTVFQQIPFRVVIGGVAKNSDRAHALSKLLLMPNTVMLTESIDQFILLIYTVDACFIGEGGTGHVAAALDKPQLILFGKVRVEAWKPLNPRVSYLSHPTDVKDLPLELIKSTLAEFLHRLSAV